MIGEFQDRRSGQGATHEHAKEVAARGVDLGVHVVAGMRVRMGMRMAV
jgi:hypothetical protein